MLITVNFRQDDKSSVSFYKGCRADGDNLIAHDTKPVEDRLSDPLISGFVDIFINDDNADTTAPAIALLHKTITVLAARQKIGEVC